MMGQPPLYPPSRAELLEQIATLRTRAAETVRDVAARAKAAEDDLDRAVAEARNAGCSWQDVADAAGMSRQGAQQRWGGRR